MSPACVSPQGLAEDDCLDASGANRVGSSSSDASDTAAAAAAAAGGRRSSTDHSSQEALPNIPACPFDAAPAQQQGSSFLQTLLTPVQQQPATTTVPIKQEPGHSWSALLSLQNEQHWLAMAERYLQAGPQPEQTSLQAAAVAGACSAAPAASASSAAAAGVGACAAAPSMSGGVSPSETAESGSSVLSELGSVDTAEQGLVIYKAFLQKASEMLALAQQQQQQSQHGELPCSPRAGAQQLLLLTCQACWCVAVCCALVCVWLLKGCIWLSVRPAISHAVASCVHGACLSLQTLLPARSRSLASSPARRSAACSPSSSRAARWAVVPCKLARRPVVRCQRHAACSSAVASTHLKRPPVMTASQAATIAHSISWLFPWPTASDSKLHSPATKASSHHRRLVSAGRGV